MGKAKQFLNNYSKIIFYFFLVLVSSCSINNIKGNISFSSKEHLNFARAYSTLSEFDNAINEYNLAIISDLNNVDAYLELADIYIQLNKIDKSIHLFNKGLLYNKNNIYILNNLAYIYHNYKDNSSKSLSLLLKIPNDINEFNILHHKLDVFYKNNEKYKVVNLGEIILSKFDYSADLDDVYYKIIYSLIELNLKHEAILYLNDLKINSKNTVIIKELTNLINVNK